MPKPKIIIVNSSTFGKHFSEHISALEAFAEISRVDVAANIAANELYPLLSEADGIIASVTPKFPREVLENCPKLVALFRHGIGCDNVDLVAATELGIRVSRVKGLVERDAVSEHAISLLMSAARHVPQGSQAVKNSGWSERSKMIGIELKGKTIGIIGLGNIGSRSSEILAIGFNSKVVAYDPHIPAERFENFGARSVSLEELLKSSSAVLFHCPLTETTKRLLSAPQFAIMKKGAVLVNTCRGELVDEDALVGALESGHLSCYATDVVEGEPIDGNHRLAKLDNVIITPHLGGYSWESLHGMGQTGVDDMISIFTKNENPGELANPQVLDKDYRKWL
jgi:phosphoglycerate dehydrogenase-like enzyme